jgi:hypothetical protein
MFVAHYQRTMRNAKPVHDAGICLHRSVSLPRLVVPKPQPPKARVVPLPRPPVSMPAHPRAIIEQIAVWHGVGVLDVVGPSRLTAVVVARHDAIAAIYLNCRIVGRFYTTPELGRLFSRDHTTILHVFDRRGIVSRRLPGSRPDRRYEAGK